jgi:hypothetical protein
MPGSELAGFGRMIRDPSSARISTERASRGTGGSRWDGYGAD